MARRQFSTDAELRELAEAYEAGASAPALGRRFGCSPSTVTAALRRAGVGIRRPGPKSGTGSSRPRSRPQRQREPAERKAIDPAEIRRLYWEEGWTLKRVAELVEVDVSIVRRRMQEFSIPIRSPGEAARRAAQAQSAMKRARLLEEARAVEIEPPGRDDRCVWRPSGLGEGALGGRRCGAPTIAKGASYCSVHAVVGRDQPTKKPEVLALTLLEEIVQGCSRCGGSWATTAGEAAEQFRQHRRACPSLTAA